MTNVAMSGAWAAIDKAFRLMNVPIDAYVTVEGEERLPEIPDRNRIFLDEDAANELRAAVEPDMSARTLSDSDLTFRSPGRSNTRAPIAP